MITLWILTVLTVKEEDGFKVLMPHERYRIALELDPSEVPVAGLMLPDIK